jgi:DMATS type aromatic prenyltransferase
MAPHEIAGGPNAEEREFWTQYCLPPFKSFLKNAKVYTEEEQESHLRFIQDVIVPRIGPKPGVKSLWTYHGSPLEFSINLTDKAEPFVRFVFDPVGGEIGDGSDPPPSEALFAHMPGLVEAVGADMRWFNQIKEWLFLKKEEVAAVREQWAAFGRVPQMFFALDLHGGERSMKAYMFPTSKSHATKSDSVDLVFDNVRRLEPYGESFGPALDAMKDYFGRSLEPLELDCLALDCVDPKDARIKIYAQAKLNPFSTVEHVATFGGKRTDETTLEGLRRLRKVWHLLLNEPRMKDDENFAAQPVDPNNRYKTLSYSWELRQGQELPDLKIYIHLWLHARDNEITLQNWENIFKTNGWEWGADGSYRAMIEDAFGKEYTTADTQVIHTCASYQFTAKKGAYMTSYMSLPVPEYKKASE